MSGGRVSVVVVGLGFGAEFVPIYQKHPDVDQVAICEADPEKLKTIGDRLGVEQRFSSLREALQDECYDAVHLLTPVPLHVEQTLAVFAAGKHCACAVPMATSLDDLDRVIAARVKADRNYMMMETAVYDRFFLYAKDLHQRGDLGTITFLRGTYFQDLEGNYPPYWRAQPPMHYATHIVGPILALTNTHADSVNCLGSGTLRSDIQMPGGNRFPLQTGVFRLAGTDIAAEVTRSWFQTARSSTEAFSVYGDRMSFEWQQLEHEEPVLYRLDPVESGRRGRPVHVTRVDVPYRTDLYPAPLAEFVRGWHGGSHPHLVHEFVRSIVEERPSAIDVATAANWTAPGICANLSSLAEGARVAIPQYLSPS